MSAVAGARTAPLRVGIVGTGWGALVHAPAFRAVDGYELVAICARRQERAEQAARRLGLFEASSDWASFVQRDDLDIISVATPSGLHHDMTLAALAAGKHVLCEKPLAATVADAEEMCRVAEEAERVTAVCFELRWRRERYTVGELVRNGVVGQPYFVRLSQSWPYWHPTRPLQALWMYDLAAGGGYLANLVVHDVDWVCSLFGDPVEVCADVRTCVPVRQQPDRTALTVTADDTSAILLRLSTGALAVLSASTAGVHTGGYRFEAFGAAGTVLAEGRRTGASVDAGRADEKLTEWPLSPREPAGLTHLPPGRGSSQAIRAMGLMLEDWLPAFSSRPSSAPTFAEGLRAQRVIDAARQSSAGAGWVSLSASIA